MFSSPVAENDRRRSLERFVAQNEELEKLEFSLRRFNMFEALRLVWREVKPLFTTYSKLYPKWNTIFSRKLVAPKAYELLDDEFEAELRSQWNRFVDKELPGLASALATISAGPAPPE